MANRTTIRIIENDDGSGFTAQLLGPGREVLSTGVGTTRALAAEAAKAAPPEAVVVTTVRAVSRWSNPRGYEQRALRSERRRG